MQKIPIRPDVKVVILDKNGPEGNIFVIMSKVSKALKLKYPLDVKTFTDEILSQTSYESALDVCRKWVDFTCK